MVLANIPKASEARIWRGWNQSPVGDGVCTSMTDRRKSPDPEKRLFFGI